MCKYCEGIYGEKIDIEGSPICKEEQPNKAQIVQLKDDEPGIVLYKNGLAQGCFDIEYCPKCGKSLNTKGDSINIINTPCKTGDLIWFIDSDNFIQWGKVKAFTETHIIVDTWYTEYRNFKEKLLISEWNKTIVKRPNREEAVKRLTELGGKDAFK